MAQNFKPAQRAIISRSFGVQVHQFGRQRERTKATTAALFAPSLRSRTHLVEVGDAALQSRHLKPKTKELGTRPRQNGG